MSMKRSKKIKSGFMCHSTAVCSVIVPTKSKYSRLVDSPLSLPPPTTNPQSPSSSHHLFQVVVMRVSLHCHGCAGKVKKHLSKMAGVTSFSIELEAKRVTVMGHISPVVVLESISKVKKAEFWYY
ncbi:protein SODIUM POTASSIUM ROOT DEFECTIVE 1-like [Mercurialis annua]|uniref:protein SODIUM POTASSIUM ROOT DEFECTIVE 1-like n=1 Tax=Mercurialis annua TaxID=3986 RepID=UPI00215DF0F9|nr:protein SODIUM POTASSIUM ROOT DEFECTIVE 1-like [Mercurialis annua]